MSHFQQCTLNVKARFYLLGLFFLDGWVCIAMSMNTDRVTVGAYIPTGATHAMADLFSLNKNKIITKDAIHDEKNLKLSYEQ